MHDTPVLITRTSRVCVGTARLGWPLSGPSSIQTKKQTEAVPCFKPRNAVVRKLSQWQGRGKWRGHEGCGKQDRVMTQILGGNKWEES